ncbi:MAG TPA: nucleotidyltransferase family protein [Candidatus Acidoferrales bacterium]|jgi:molybdenum cofactor cytidylyltransferase|nr:nucleotidyltransferase family protein [Candidatus Acidoferrales bacterium]
MQRPVYVVLAAGAARRMGFDKVLTALDGRSPLARVVAALGERERIVVVPSSRSAQAAAAAPDSRIVTNDEPDRGMTRSLLIALECVRRERAFGVLPADMPAMSEATVAATEAMLTDDVDVAYPVDESGVPGHPVLFAARARAIVEALPEGDTLRRARDDATLRRATWVCMDRSAFFDVDEPADWERGYGEGG